jgi:hypothetical protein
MAKEVKLETGENVLQLDELEVCALYSSLKNTIVTKEWNLLDEVDWNELGFSKNLLHNLENYLNNKPME